MHVLPVARVNLSIGHEWLFQFQTIRECATIVDIAYIDLRTCSCKEHAPLTGTQHLAYKDGFSSTSTFYC